MLFVEPAQTEAAPVIQLEIAGFTVTVFVMVVVHDPSEVVNVRVKEHVLVPAFTVTVEVLVAPIMVPFPLILHA